MKNQHGGKRKGAGRPPKADELKLLESMDAIAVPDEIWEMLYNKCTEGNVAAIKLWLEYRYGKPKQRIDASFTPLEPISRPIIKAIIPPNAKSLKYRLKSKS